ncbi:MAG: SEC-C metal-binding domain-containing protein [Candidatus Cloacimonadota bacterium]|nr:SEC-C metal-binding domain-containing protein [Candidatus Cloacimonadota bacterium]
MKLLHDDLKSINEYLKNHNGITIDDNILELLKKRKKEFVERNQQTDAKKVWCLQQIFIVKKHYITAYNSLCKKEFYKAWCEFDRADIELSFLTKHLDISDNRYNLKFISHQIRNFQKLFPYRSFMSREAIIKKSVCNICGKTIGIKNSCEHKIGEIYNGEMCSRSIKDLDVLGFSYVKNPFDKYTVLFPKDMEYNYKKLENLIEHLNSPFEKWKVVIEKTRKPEFKKCCRNNPCPCGSGLKYKECCWITGNDSFDHYKILFLDKPKGIIKPLEIVSTWK